MEESALVGFQFEGFNVRTVTINSEPWFVASDVAEVLGYSDTQAMTRRLDADEVESCTDNSSGQGRNISIINESGLYNAILGSNKPNAKRFKKWVTALLLPTIRKDGGYMVATPEMTEIEILAKAVLIGQKAMERRDLEIAELKRTKAHITAGREAQAMGRVGGLTRALNEANTTIEDQAETIEDLSGNGNFSTISENGYWLKNYVKVSETKSAIGRLITKISRLNGYPVDRFRKLQTATPDFYIDVKVYHNTAWSLLKASLDKDKSVLDGYRIDIPKQEELF